jgi:hypothetical protein
MRTRSWILAGLVMLWSSAAHAAVINYYGNLSGPAEAPPNASPGTGFARVTYDTVAHTLDVNVEFQNLLGPTSASHIHCCVDPPGAAGVATTTPTFFQFPLGVTSGTYSRVLDLTLASSWNPAFIAANGGTPASAEAVLAAGLDAGRSYFNIHTSLPLGFPGGEIRDFLTVPEPATLSLLGFGVIAVLRRRRQR